jgi:hypothetical protein
MEFLYSTRWKSIPEIRCFGASGHWHGDGRRGAKSAECQPIFFSGNSEQVNTGVALILLLGLEFMLHLHFSICESHPRNSSWGDVAKIADKISIITTITREFDSGIAIPSKVSGLNNYLFSLPSCFRDHYLQQFS